MTNDKIQVTRWWEGPDGRIGSDTATYVQVPEGDERSIRIEGREGWWFLLHSSHSPAFPTSHKVEPTGEMILGVDIHGRPQEHAEYAAIQPPPDDPYWNAAEWKLADGYKPATAEDALRQADKDRKREEKLIAELHGAKK